MTVCEFVVAIIGPTASECNQSAQSALIPFVCFYSTSLSSPPHGDLIAWVITGEIFLPKIRAKAMSLSVTSNWVWNWSIAFSSECLFLLRCAFAPILILFNNIVPGRLWLRKRKLGYQGVLFYIWGSTCFCCILFAYFYILETKDLSLEQIDLLHQHVAPVHSVSYCKRLLAEGTELSKFRYHITEFAKRWFMGLLTPLEPRSDDWLDQA
jgi:MFS transporter, SP family, sugar:H+ symporter